MDARGKRVVAIAVFTLLYPLLSPLVALIPNPIVPGAGVALHIILPVLCGYFYGPVSGAIAGGMGAGIASLVWASPFDAMAVFPHALMGATAGWAGNYRHEYLAAICVFIGHFLNILFFTRAGLLTVSASELSHLFVGVFAEGLIDIVAVLLAIMLLRRKLYSNSRW